jgi:hypothetical protein
MTAPDPAAGLDDATLEALLGDVQEIDDVTDTPPADWKPPTYAEQKAMEAKLQKANNSARNMRLRLKGTPSPAAIPPKPGTPAAGAPQGDPAPVDAAKLRAEIEAEYKAKQDTAAVQSAAVTALVAAGLALPAENRTGAPCGQAAGSGRRVGGRQRRRGRCHRRRQEAVPRAVRRPGWRR